MKKKNNTFKVKIKYSQLPNLFHQEQVMKGGKVHKNKYKLIPRKQKYKNKVNEDE